MNQGNTHEEKKKVVNSHQPGTGDPSSVFHLYDPTPRIH